MRLESVSIPPPLYDASDHNNLSISHPQSQTQQSSSPSANAQQQRQQILCSLQDIVDNNNAAVLSSTAASSPTPLSSAPTAPTVPNNNAALEACWARRHDYDGTTDNCSPCPPAEEDEEDEEEGVSGGVSSSSSSGRASSRSVRSDGAPSSCPSSCSSSCSSDSELANLSSVTSGDDCSEDEPEPVSPPSPSRYTCASPSLHPPDLSETPATPVSPCDGQMSEPEEEHDAKVIDEEQGSSSKAKEIIKVEEDTRPASNNNNNSSSSSETLGEFDVFTMETALPKLDLAQLESHLLAAARHEDRRRRNDREEIRRRLAMGEETERPGGRKPSLQSRLQSGMNLQLCFMNETASDCDSPSDRETAPKKPSQPVPIPVALTKSTSMDPDQMQREAQLALAQASAMAHMEMNLERQHMRFSATPSPTSRLLQRSLHKVGVIFPPERRRVSRQLLTELNVAQLQVLVNDLHTLIEGLNEELVQMLMERDDLHMEQDSRLVDIEDLNRYLGAKSQPLPEGLRR